MTITRLLARPMLATIFVVGGVNALRATEAHAAKAKKAPAAAKAAIPLREVVFMMVSLQVADPGWVRRWDNRAAARGVVDGG